MSATETLPVLNAKLMQQSQDSPSIAHLQSLPEKVLQFGEGNFLRGFVDWMIDGMNRKGLFGGRVVIVQPLAQGLIAKLNEQNGLYTLLLRGLQNGNVIEDQKVINAVNRGVDPYADFQGYLACAHNPDLRFIVSNTTEAGIAFSPDDRVTDCPPSSFPGKLTVFLLERYKAFGGDLAKGFVMIPCELIDRNGDNLKAAVLKTAAHWQLEAGFIEWVEKANTFTNTLVDRIVTGYPRGEVEALWAKAGYRDDLFDCAEPFHLWVIEAPQQVSKELPLKEAGFNVVWTSDMTPYRERKVRILNGAHTVSVLAAYLVGKDYVGELMEDELTSSFMERAVRQEVIPTLNLPKQELDKFAEEVFERFSNPFIRHALLSISLNSVSKYKARVLPSLEAFISRQGKLPNRLVFGLAALIVFYRGTEIRGNSLVGKRNGAEYLITDDMPILKAFSELWSRYDAEQLSAGELTDEVLGKAGWWGKDLRNVAGLSAVTAGFVQLILQGGMTAALRQIG